MQINSAKDLKVYKQTYDLPEGGKRRYEAHFNMKLTDCDGENSETDTWLDFAKNCGYLKENDHCRLSEKYSAVGRMLGSMLRNPGPFLLKP